jgi:hypothetical protein
MARMTNPILALGALGAGFALIAAQPAALAQVQPGLWEISGMPGMRAPVRQCVATIASFARFEHRAKNCSARIIKDGASLTAIEYTCGGAGFGHSEIEVLTPRSLRISTQGISDGLPFNYVLQARRIDDCQKTATFTRH